MDPPGPSVCLESLLQQTLSCVPPSPPQPDAQARESIAVESTRRYMQDVLDDGELARRLRYQWDTWSHTPEYLAARKKRQRYREKGRCRKSGPPPAPPAPPAAAGDADARRADSDPQAHDLAGTALIARNAHWDEMQRRLPSAFRFGEYGMCRDGDTETRVIQKYAHRIQPAEQNVLFQPVPAETILGAGRRVWDELRCMTPMPLRADWCVTVDVYSSLPAPPHSSQSLHPSASRSHSAPTHSASVLSSSSSDHSGGSSSDSGSGSNSDSDSDSDSDADADSDVDAASRQDAPRQPSGPVGGSVLRGLTHTQTLEIDASSPLSLLRSAIVCRWDDAPAEERVDEDGLPHYACHPPPDLAVLCMENTLYFAEPHSGWASDVSSACRMKHSHQPWRDIRLSSLPSLRLGQPYWLRHSGTCTHMFVLRTMHLTHVAHNTLPQVTTTFLSAAALQRPALSFARPGSSALSYRGGKCRLCEMHLPQYLLYGGARIGLASNMLVCGECVTSLLGPEALASQGKGWTIIPLLE